MCFLISQNFGFCDRFSKKKHFCLSFASDIHHFENHSLRFCRTYYYTILEVLFALYSKIRFLRNFQTFNTFRPKSAWSDVTEVDIIQNKFRPITFNFNRMCQTDVREDRCVPLFFFLSYSRSYTGGSAPPPPPPRSMAGQSSFFTQSSHIVLPTCLLH